MGATSGPSNNPSEPSDGESRRLERIYEPFPVIVRSVDASGERFEIHTVLSNFSASHLYVRLERRVDPGTKLFALVRLSTSEPELPAPRVAVRGVVVSVEPRYDGTWIVGVN